MIKFFRQVRKSLFMDNKTGKYFKYAIGEIILVVLGILIALQINNLNEERKQRVVELNILQQLQKDLGSNVSDLKLNLGIQETMVTSSKLVFQHLNGNEAYDDALSEHMANTFLWSKFITNSGAYENIKSRGVEIISNVALREYILIIYEQNFKWNKEFEQTIINASETFRHQQAYKFFSKLRMIESFNVNQAGHAEVIDYEKLRSDNQYKFYLNQMIGDTEYQIEAITKKHIEDHKIVLEMIDQEIA